MKKDNNTNDINFNNKNIYSKNLYYDSSQNNIQKKKTV